MKCPIMLVQVCDKLIQLAMEKPNNVSNLARSIKLEDEALHFKSDIQEENTTPFSRIIEVFSHLDYLNICQVI